MNILQLNTERTWRGGERQTLWTAQGLQQFGDNCIIACRQDFPLYEKAHESGMKVIPSDPLGPWDLLSAYRLKRLAMQHSIDIIHTQTAHTLTLCGLARMLGMKTPVVASRRVDFPVNHVGKYNRCAAVIAISTAIKKVLVRSGVKPGLIHLIPSGVSPVDVSVDATLRKQLLSDGDLLVGTIGHLAHHKGFDILIDAWGQLSTQLPGARLIIVGEGEERESLEKQISKRNLQGVVTLTGFVESPAQYLACLDLYLQPSRTEGLGTAAIEALLLGLPLIVSDSGGLPEVVGGGQWGRVVPAGDSHALASAILEGATSLDHHDGSEAQAWAQQHFSLEAMVASTRSVYQQILA